MTAAGVHPFEGSPSRLHRVRNFIGDEAGGHGEIPAAHTLAGSDQVWRDRPVVDREIGACAPQTAHHLVGDEEHVVGVTDLTDLLEISRRCGRAAQGRAHHRLGNEGRNVFRTFLEDRGLQRAGAFQPA
jgi:hypothetical protein